MRKARKSPMRFRWVLAIAAACMLIFALPILLVWQHVTTVKIAREIENTRKAIQMTKARNAVLQIEVDALLSHNNIEKFAKNHLRMTYPKPEQVVFISSALSKANTKRYN